MLARSLKRFNSKVGIIAGGPSTDYKGAKIIKALSGDKSPVTEFFGVGGPEMISNKLESYASINSLTDKPFYPTFHFDSDPRFYLNPVMLPQNLKYLLLSNELKGNGFWNKFEDNEKQDVDMLITIDNQLLAFRLYEKLEKFYKNEDGFKPLRIHYDKTIRNYKWDYLRSIDYLIYSLPNPSRDLQRFKFPSQFVGVQGVFDALSYVYSNYPEYKQLVTSSYLLADVEHTYDMVRHLKIKKREEFRKKHSLNENGFFLFISPGNQPWEIAANKRGIIDGIIDFSKSLKPGQILVPIISLQDPTEVEQFREEIQKHGIFCYFLENPTKEEKFDAMMASTFGAIEKGDMLFEAMALHLPTIALDSSGNLKAYFNLMYNQWGTNLNWAAEGLMIPESTLWNFGTKISEFWQEWNNNPTKYFSVILQYSRMVFRMLPARNDLSYESPEDELHDKQFKFLFSPDHVLDQFLKDKYSKYAQLKKLGADPQTYQRKRKALLLEESEDYF